MLILIGFVLHLSTGVNVSISEDASAARAKLPETERSLSVYRWLLIPPSHGAATLMHENSFSALRKILTVQSRCELVEHVLGTLCGHVSRWQHIQYGRITHSSFQWIHLVVHCSCMCVVGMDEHMSSVQLVFIPLSFFLTQFEASTVCDSSIVGTAVVRPRSPVRVYLSYPSSPRNVT